MCHSNNVVIYRVVFGPERMTYSVNWIMSIDAQVQMTKLYICATVIML